MYKRSESHFQGTHKKPLFYQSWDHDQPLGTLVLVHGFAEHSDCYNRFATGIQDLGVSIHALDLQGHGRSPGQRGFIPDFSHYIRDLRLFLEHLDSIKLLQGPVFLLGHSMGGLISLRYLIDEKDSPIDSLLLSSPLLGISVEVPKIKDIASKILGKFAPKVTLHNEIDTDNLSRDPEVRAEYGKDILRHEKISAPIYLGMIENFDYVFSNIQKVNRPAFFQIAGEDMIVSRPETERFFNKLQSDEKKLIIYKDSYHEIFNDLDRLQVYKDFKEFLIPRLK